MTTAKKPEKKAESWAYTFVRCELDKDTKEKVKEWDKGFKATVEGIDSLIAAGYKVAFSADTYHDCVGCFISAPSKEHVHYGQCLSARGPSVLAAAKVAVYKHFHVLDGDWGTIVNQTDQRDEWG
jgi:hypothetical protein